MEPVTHILTGACLARTGLNRKAAYATLAMAIGAEFPDIDTLSSLRGPLAGFEHHRGITHTFLGLPFEAAIVVGLVYGLHRWRAARYNHRLANAPLDSEPNYDPRRPALHYDDRERIVRPLTAAPVRWGRLYAFTLLALLSHLLLDFTNNYGLRPFFPFNPHWYAASIVFIFDPLIFVLLLAALVLPALFALVGREVGSRRSPFRPRWWSAAALLAIVALWTLREVDHNHAVQLAMSQSVATPPEVTAADTAQADQDAVNPNSPAPSAPPPVYAAPLRALANPDPFSVFRWYTVTDYGRFYELDTADSSANALAGNGVARSKAPAAPAVLAAQASPLGRVYLDWSTAPLLEAGTPDAAGRSTVTFSDLRFAGGIPPFLRSRRPPLTGEVTVDAHGRILAQVFDGRDVAPHLR